jgi:polar amino acid transport system permease protein
MEGQLIASSTFKYTSILSMVAVLYLVMSVPLILFVGWLERRMQQARK